VFSVVARWKDEDVELSGEIKSFTRTGDDGGDITFGFCSECGGTLFFRVAAYPDYISVTVGSFADSDFPLPQVSIFGKRQHSWVSLPDGCKQYE